MSARYEAIEDAASCRTRQHGHSRSFRIVVFAAYRSRKTRRASGSDGRQVQRVRDLACVYVTTRLQKQWEWNWSSSGGAGRGERAPGVQRSASEPHAPVPPALPPPPHSHSFHR